nr:MAG TPA: hypothetical protein [Caudoviricetes sp.]
MKIGFCVNFHYIDPLIGEIPAKIEKELLSLLCTTR